MRCISTLTAIAIATALGAFAPGLSGHGNGTRNGTGGPQEGVPAGSYQQTCSDISARKGTLYAKCQDVKGKSHSAKLSHYDKCGSDIANRDGRLECSGGSGGNAAAPSQPSGSYTETCKNIRMKGTTLHAVCRSIDGREMPTSLKDADRCSQGVANINGILNCAVSDVLPPGSYMATCKDIRLQGTTLLASCNNGRDRWLPAGLREANKCSGDIANQEGRLRCTAFKKVERR
jgi:hypothetical protein